MNYQGYERIIKAGTTLICPLCRSIQATVLVDLCPDKAFDWRAIKPLEHDAIIGVSTCCNERYVTFSGLFYTIEGAI